MSNKIYNYAPLPFQGQKRNMLKHFKQVLKQYDEECVFVDLFGGSGLLSHTARREKPKSDVIYNDYDNYRERLLNIERTNHLITELRAIVAGTTCKKRVSEETKNAIVERIKKEAETGFVDYATLSSNILFSGRIAKTIEGIEKEHLYNRVRNTNYNNDGYLDGVTVVHYDYKELAKRYKGFPNFVYIIDPPYLSTDNSSYNSSYWKLSDYLDVLELLREEKFIFFTAEKSNLIELLEWLKREGIDFITGTERIKVKSSVNYKNAYSEVLIYKK